MWVEVHCWIDHEWSSNECACCACDHSVHQVFFTEVISSCKNLRTGSQVFALLMWFLCVNFHTVWSGKSRQLLCILSFDMLCLSAISMMFVVNVYVGMSESGLCLS